LKENPGIPVLGKIKKKKGKNKAMILKTLTHDRGNSDCWNYYSGVRYASVFYNEESDIPCIAIRGDDIDGEIIVGLTGPSYLCTDNGQTIEKIGQVRPDDGVKKFEG